MRGFLFAAVVVRRFRSFLKVQSGEVSSTTFWTSPVEAADVRQQEPERAATRQTGTIGNTVVGTDRVVR